MKEEEPTPISIPTPGTAISSRYEVDKSLQSAHIEEGPAITSRYGVDISHIEPDKARSEDNVPIQIPSMVISSPIVAPPPPFPRKKANDTDDTKYEKFVKVLKSLKITIPFTDALSEMPAYTKFLKEILARKTSIPDLFDECNSLSMSNHCSALQKTTSPKSLVILGGLLLPSG